MPRRNHQRTDCERMRAYEQALMCEYPKTFGNDRPSARIVAGLLCHLKEGTEVCGIPADVASTRTGKDVERVVVALVKAHWLQDRGRANGDADDTPRGRLLDVREDTKDPGHLRAGTFPVPGFIAHALAPAVVASASGRRVVKASSLPRSRKLDDAIMWKHWRPNSGDLGRLRIGLGREMANKARYRGEAAALPGGPAPAPRGSAPAATPDAPAAPAAAVPAAAPVVKRALYSGPDFARAIGLKRSRAVERLHAAEAEHFRDMPAAIREPGNNPRRGWQVAVEWLRPLLSKR